MRAKRDGQPIPGTEGTITAEQQAAALGIDKTEPKPAPLRPTPAQARRAMSNEWIGEDLDPPDWEASVIDDPSTIANALGLRPEDFDTIPLGSAPEGMPIPQPGIRPKIEPRRERAHEAAPPPDPAAVNAAADELRAQYRAHVRRVTAMAATAKASGDAEREARAAAEVRATAELGERLKAKLGGSL